MSIAQLKPRPRHSRARATDRTMPASAVRALLLELAYRLNATRAVQVLPEANRATGRARP